MVRDSGTCQSNPVVPASAALSSFVLGLVLESTGRFSMPQPQATAILPFCLLPPAHGYHFESCSTSAAQFPQGVTAAGSSAVSVSRVLSYERLHHQNWAIVDDGAVRYQQMEFLQCPSASLLSLRRSTNWASICMLALFRLNYIARHPHLTFFSEST